MLTPKGNPQGKGLSLVLEGIAGLTPKQFKVKCVEQLLADYWQSTLVLSASFRFSVVPNQQYYLYHNAHWSLSLVSPEEWGDKCPGVFVAYCRLNEDATWTLDFAMQSLANPKVTEALHQFLEGFEYQLSNCTTLLEALPAYQSHLPYQQRMMATALSCSLRHSALLSGIAALPTQKLPALTLIDSPIVGSDD